MFYDTDYSSVDVTICDATIYDENFSQQKFIKKQLYLLSKFLIELLGCAPH